MAAFVVGTLALDGTCLGLRTSNGFVPVVLRIGTFSFDGQTLTLADRATALGETLQSAGGLVTLPRDDGPSLAAGCTQYTQVAYLNPITAIR